MNSWYISVKNKNGGFLPCFVPITHINLHMMSGNLKYVKNLRIIKPESEPGLMAVTANGVAEISRQYRPVLVPRQYKDAPEDGILEMDFVLIPAEENDISDIEMEVNIIFRIKDLPPWVKGLRVNAAENSDIELI